TGLYGKPVDAVLDVSRRRPDLARARVRTYESGWAKWTANQTLPVERLPNYDKLVHTGWLRRLLDGERPEAAPAGRFLLFHVNFGVPEEDEENHIPAALYVDTNRLESPAALTGPSPDEPG